MDWHLDLTDYRKTPVFSLGEDFTDTAPDGTTIAVNSFYPELNGKPWLPVSGEIHFSRLPRDRWERELIKTRMGGVNVVSTYVFWNHHEEEEGVFDFAGQRDLRRFVELCWKHRLYVILRVGPFCHGEVRNGGLPDWLWGKPFEVRQLNDGFMACVSRLYAQIGAQVKGLFFRDGGPIIGVQLDNEYMHSSAPWEMTTGVSDEWVFPGNEGEEYLLKLRELALESGLTPAFFTGTAWGGAAYSPRILPLWGGYAYRPWIFYSHKGAHPATEEYVYEDYHRSGAVWADDFAPVYDPGERPYACCEMGAGMMCCYHYRFVFPFRSVDALANIKLGSGCNLIGYYMYHGGTNPVSRKGVYLNESQVAKRSYDYQAPLGEFGQVRASYSRLKTIHSMLQAFGERLAPMETVLPPGASGIDPCDRETLRFAARTDGEAGFLFINNFQDHFDLPQRRKDRVRISTKAGTCTFDISLASGENAILPFHFDMEGILLKQATAQVVLRTVIRNRAVYVFMAPDGLDGSLLFEEGTEVCENAISSAAGRLLTARRGGREVDALILSREQANQLYLLRDGALVFTDAALLEDEQGRLRLETTQNTNVLRCFPPDRLAGVTAAVRCPDEGCFGVYQVNTAEKNVMLTVRQTSARRYELRLGEDALEGLVDVRLRIDYQGDIGLLFLGNELISDNLANSATWETGLWEYRERLKREPLTLVITPLRKGAKVQAETPMAGRRKEAEDAVARLVQASAQPVYEIALSQDNGC